MTFVLSVATSGWQWRWQDGLCTTVMRLCACRTLWLSLFPQRLILSRFGRFVIHDSLIATPTRYSLIHGVVCTLGARTAHKLGAQANRKLGARAAHKLGAQANRNLGARAARKLGAQANRKLGERAAGPQRFADSTSSACMNKPRQRLHLNSKHGMHRFRILSTAKQPEHYAHAVPCVYRFSLNGSS